MLTMSWLVIVVKWLSQLLIIATGIFSLFMDPYKEDPKTHRRKLTRVGYVAMSALLIGFVLFALTDLNERQQATARLEHQKEVISNQERALTHHEKQQALSRKLLLSKYTFSDIEFSWTPSERLFKEIVKIYKKLPGDFPARFAYSTVKASKVGESWRIHYSGGGPNTYTELSDDVTTEKPEWSPFREVIDVVLPGRFFGQR